jgi:hypothetical protein
VGAFAAALNVALWRLNRKTAFEQQRREDTPIENRRSVRE